MMIRTIAAADVATLTLSALPASAVAAIGVMIATNAVAAVVASKNARTLRQIR